MNRFQGLRRLEFNNKPLIDQKIETMFSNFLIFIGDLNRLLAIKRYSQIGKFEAKGLFVERFKKSRA